MSKTNYSRKFIQTNLSFNKTSSLYQEDNDKMDYKIKSKTKDSWKFFIHLKNIQNLKRINSLKDINNFLTPNKNNPNFVPISNKYSILKYNKAPTLRQNLKEINKIIKRKKAIKLKDFNNIYNTILINESRSFRNNLYITSGEINSNSKINITLDRNRNRNKNKNISIEPLIRNKKFNFIIDNINSFSNDNLIFNNETGINSNSNNKEFNNESNLNYDNKINKSKSLPKLNVIKKDTKTIYSFRSNNNNLTKMRVEINDTIFNNLKNTDFANLEKKVIKFKVLQKIRNKNLYTFLGKEEYDLDKKYNILIKLRNLIEKNFAIYSEKMYQYLHFLLMKKKEIEAELIIYDKDINEKNKEIEKLILDIIKYQSELESFINDSS